MRSIKIFFLALSIFALALVPVSTIGQSTLDDRINEFSPLQTSRPLPTQRPLTPLTKFVKVEDAIPNRYIVVLNDDVVRSDAPLKVRRAEITAIANSHAQAYLGRVGFVYESALKGYSIELPDESIAIKLSENPEVKWVEEVGRMQVSAFQTNPPWGLDRIDQTGPVGPVSGNGTTTGLYIYNVTGSGVTAYVLDTGIRSTHQDFGGRASIAANFIDGTQYLDLCAPTAGNNDCGGHGTNVAGIIGGATYGVAKQVTILSVKVCSSSIFVGCPTDAINAGINWVSNHHLSLFNTAIANMSLGGPAPTSMDAAVQSSINAGVTYAIAAGNSNDDARFTSPADVVAALTVGATNSSDSRSGFSNFGGLIDVFAPGEFIVSAGIANDSDVSFFSGTSQASPHVAGAVALYLQGRLGMSTCTSLPIQGPSAPSNGAVSGCPDRVTRFIKSNANLSKLTNTGGIDHNGIAVTSPNRLLWTAAIPTTVNPIDNQRFFIWQHYGDFLTGQPEPDEGGLNFWTGNITGPCGTGFNDNNSCTHTKRIDVSRAFWVAAFPSLFTGNGSALTNNSQFVHKCYEVYLRRSIPDSDGGFQFWLNDLNSYGNPANQAGINHLIDAFMNSGEYRQRYGQ